MSEVPLYEGDKEDAATTYGYPLLLKLTEVPLLL